MVKRRGLKPPPPPLSSTPPPQTPSTPPLKVTANPTTTAGTKARRSLAPTLLADGWIPLHVPRSELSLPLTLPTGQTFRWRCTTAGQYTGVVGPHLLSLKHLDDGGEIAFLLHDPTADAPAAAAAALRDYLNLGISIANMWEKFSDADLRFAELALGFEGGARVLRQDPVECVLQFLCSSNNNIGRIEKMVGVLSSFGKYLGTVGGFDFHEFPTLDRLSLVSELQLREAGFGYRAKYIVGAVQALRTKPGGGSQWLASLRALKLPEVIDALCTLPGIGPKVSACIALFSLDKHHAIPVDTHVWQDVIDMSSPAAVEPDVLNVVPLQTEKPKESSFVRRLKTKARKRVHIPDCIMEPSVKTTKKKKAPMTPIPTQDKPPSERCSKETKRLYDWLSDEHKRRLDNIWWSSKTQQVWRSNPTNCVFVDGLMNVINDKCLDNTIVNAFTHILQRFIDENKKKDERSFFFDTAAFWAAKENREEEIKSFIISKIKKAQNYRYNFFPINTGRQSRTTRSNTIYAKSNTYDHHWTLLVLDNNTGNWTHYNPMRVRPNIHDHCLEEAKILKQVVEDRTLSAIPNFRLSQAEVIEDKHCPQQHDSTVDCGVLICYYMDFLSNMLQMKQHLTLEETKQYRVSIARAILNDSKFAMKE